MTLRSLSAGLCFLFHTIVFKRLLTIKDLWAQLSTRQRRGAHHVFPPPPAADPAELAPSTVLDMTLAIAERINAIFPRRQLSAPRRRASMAAMRYLHTMVRVHDLASSLAFYCGVLGMVEISRKEFPQGRFTLVFLAAPEDASRAQGERAPMLELTYNWDPEKYGEGRNFGHLAFEVDDIYAICARLEASGVVINRPPRDGHMAFVRSPDNISVELLQKGEALAPRDPWKNMPNSGQW